MVTFERCAKCKVRIHKDDMDLHIQECGKVEHHYYPMPQYIGPIWQIPPQWRPPGEVWCGIDTVSADAPKLSSTVNVG